METHSGLIACVTRDGAPLVLKLAKPESEEAKAAAVLRAYDGRSAVRVIEHEGAAMLLERALPGLPLSSLSVSGQDSKATAIICDIILDLHREPAAHGDGPNVEHWGRGFERYEGFRPSSLPRALVRHAHEVFSELCRSQGARYLLHGDLHHDNILFDERRGWLAIDPKGVAGERAYEIGCALRNPFEAPNLAANPTVMRDRVAIASERLGAHRGRILGWCFSQAVLSAIWSIEDGDGDANVAHAAAISRTALSLMQV